jgi:hypothetical protein
MISKGLTFRVVDCETWCDLETLFESRGGPVYCWCMVWRPCAARSRPAAAAMSCG